MRLPERAYVEALHVRLRCGTWAISHTYKGDLARRRAPKRVLSDVNIAPATPGMPFAPRHKRIGRWRATKVVA